MIRSAVVSTPLGPAAVAVSTDGIRALTLPAPDAAAAIRALARICPGATEPLPEPRRLELESTLHDVLMGQANARTLSLDPEGTAFQRAVWSAIGEIPRGETRSYGWIAAHIGRRGAARAVGQATGANPLPLIVPCHRVIAHDGSLGGYYGGRLHLKRALLQMEGALPPI
ncbi:MAG: MGMT family protein [Dehalococcoidia bacterium]|nr:MGMT family protein [Dehalococcoidia bacterium]